MRCLFPRFLGGLAAEPDRAPPGVGGLGVDQPAQDVRQGDAHLAVAPAEPVPAPGFCQWVAFHTSHPTQCEAYIRTSPPR